MREKESSVVCIERGKFPSALKEVIEIFQTFCGFLHFVCVIVSSDLSDILFSNGYRISFLNYSLGQQKQQRHCRFRRYLSTDWSVSLLGLWWWQRVTSSFSLKADSEAFHYVSTFSHKRSESNKKQNNPKILKLRFEMAKWIFARDGDYCNCSRYTAIKKVLNFICITS